MSVNPQEPKTRQEAAEASEAVQTKAQCIRGRINNSNCKPDPGSCPLRAAVLDGPGGIDVRKVMPMIEWIHTGTVLRAYNPDNHRRGMIVRKISRSAAVYAVFADGGIYVGSARSEGQARGLCKEELEHDTE